MTECFLLVRCHFYNLVNYLAKNWCILLSPYGNSLIEVTYHLHGHLLYN